MKPKSVGVSNLKPFLANSTGELIRQLITDCIPNSYYFFLNGYTPEDEEPTETDSIILNMIEAAKWRMGSRKDQAQVQYLRHHRTYLLLATAGVHPIINDNAHLVRDIRKTPLGFNGYSISCQRVRGGSGYRGSVQVGVQYFGVFREKFLAMSVRSSAVEMTDAFLALNFEPYPPVHEQLGALLKAVNEKRRAAGLELVRRSAVGLGGATVKSIKPMVKRSSI
jgi:hypothetical protein